LTGAKVIPKPGETLASATVVIRDGFIEAVGPEIVPPPDARVWDLTGATIYAGFIDAYLTLGGTNTPISTARVEPIDAGSAISAGEGMNFFGVPGSERDPGQPGPGHRLAQITPERRVVQTYAPDPRKLESLRELGFTSANVVPERGILRGTGAFVALAETDPNEVVIRPDVFQHGAFDTDGPRSNAYPRSLMGVIAAVRQAFFDAQHYAQDHADNRQRPQARQRAAFNPAFEALASATQRKTPVVIEPGSALMVDRAARIARELELEFHLASCGQEWRRPELAKATGAAFIVPLNFPALPKLPDPADWDQVTLDQLRAWDWAPENPAVLRQSGLEIALTTYGLADRKSFRKNLRLALDRGLSEADALAALTVIPARLCGVAERLGTIEPGKLAHLTVVDGDSYFNPDAKVREVWIDGRIHRVQLDRTKPRDAGGEAKPDEGEPGTDAKPSRKENERRALQKQRVARSPLDGRGPLAQPPAVLVTGATIWTCGPDGIVSDADLLVVGGKVNRVGPNQRLRSDDPGPPLVIDASGKHVTPGLIDAHSHSMILGGANEGTLPSSAMVRIGDVVNSETANIYNQLAGGLTVANVLHGSANPIGGQNAILKLRDGASPEELKMAGAPAGIKFALGENVKQSNREQAGTRFPQTRMGVRTFLANRFTTARQYLAQWQDHRKNGGVPPRRDLELEALGEVLQGQRWIHCHSYRQDEILAFLRLMEDFGVQVGTLQHVLEGYKVADEIARHGAGASCFSDWWAYKFEVYDAIPYAGSLMRARGALVSFNSDSSDLARRLYADAAKAVKYGGIPEQEALKFVTLNPARQLRIADRVGSLEPGKDGDFVIWSKSPLDATSVCLQTWIEGKKYFDRDQASARTAALEKERTELIAKAKKLLALGGGSGESEAARATFFQTALEHAHDHHDRHCEDD
jgi:imidazolonepropionase-like amidohydrolase